MENNTRRLMKSIFNVDNRLMRMAERIYDLVILNLLFLLTCLPILTIGCAKLSLYHVLCDMKHRQHLPIIRLYFDSFKKHWKKGLKLGTIELGVTFICWTDLFVLQQIHTTWATALQVLCISLIILSTVTFLYAYPLGIHTHYTIQELLKKAFMIAGLNFPKTFLLLGILGALFVILYLSSWTFLIGLSLLLLIGCSGLGYYYMQQIEKILKKYTISQFENVN